MSTLWLDDLDGFKRALETINKRWNIERGDTEASATLEISQTEYKAVVRATEFRDQEQNIPLASLEITFDTNYQSIDEVLYTLENLLGLEHE